MIRQRVRALTCALLCGGSAPAMAIEEPAYEVVSSGEIYEIRRYAPYIVAETDVTGDLDDAGGKAFRILAGYIFGKNDDQQKMKMTAPVESRPLTGAEPMRTSSAGPDGAFTFGFVMEDKYTLDTLPSPIDPRISLREIPARTIAAHRFSGRWTDGKYNQHETALLEALERDGHQPVAAPVFARYNGPMTPWFMRRNEILVEIAQP